MGFKLLDFIKSLLRCPGERLIRNALSVSSVFVGYLSVATTGYAFIMLSFEYECNP